MTAIWLLTAPCSKNNIVVCYCYSFLVANVIYEKQAGDRKGIICFVIYAFTPICTAVKEKTSKITGFTDFIILNFFFNFNCNIF